MKLTALNYYKDFHCIAGDCRHSCCIGWEIDVDYDTYSFYKTVKGEFGKRLKNSITDDGNNFSFCLTSDERCPFLNENNLCDIITELGENNLCQICADHPRFRNYFGDRTEIGLGLCCEAAGRLILGNKTKVFDIILEETPGTGKLSDLEKSILTTRSKMFAVIQNREEPIKNRIDKIKSIFNIYIPNKSIAEWADIYLTLECMDLEWTKLLKNLKAFNNKDFSFLNEKFETESEQLLIYFLYRHLADAETEEDIKSRTAFCILSYSVIRAICALKLKNSGECSFDDLVEFARLYSAEIEYSTENIDILLDIIRNN